MMELKDIFVPDNIAGLAAVNGFDEKCFAVYDMGNFELNNTYPSNSTLKDVDVVYMTKYTAPTYDQLLLWFDRKNIIIQPVLIEQLGEVNEWGFELTNGNISTDESKEYDTRHEALNDAFLIGFEMIKTENESNDN